MLHILWAVLGGLLAAFIQPRFALLGLWLGFVASYGGHKYISTEWRDGRPALIIGRKREGDNAD